MSGVSVEFAGMYLLHCTLLCRSRDNTNVAIEAPSDQQPAGSQLQIKSEERSSPWSPGITCNAMRKEPMFPSGWLIALGIASRPNTPGMAGDEVVYKILWGKLYFDIGGSITLDSYFGMRAKSLAL